MPAPAAFPADDPYETPRADDGALWWILLEDADHLAGNVGSIEKGMREYVVGGDRIAIGPRRTARCH